MISQTIKEHPEAIKMENKPLSGIKVVELATVVAAPSCGRLLAALGADVIKVEPPKGDPWRLVYAVIGKGFDELEDPIFDICNSGKRTISIDIKNPRGYDLLMELIGDADVFLTNTRARSLRKLNLDPDSIRERFPGIIYASLTSYGDKGPEADKPGFDNSAFWTRIGFARDTAIETEGCYPMNLPTGVGDSISGMALCNNILAALISRGKTGKGDYVSVSLYGVGLWVMGTMILRSQERYGAGFPINRERCNPTSTAYKCSDGRWVLIAILEYKRHAPVMFEALGYPDIMSDPRFSTHEDFWNNSAILLKMAEESFLKKSSDEWLEIFAGLDIACERLNSINEALEDEQAWLNGYLEHYDMLCGESCVISRMPINLESFEIPPSPPAPLFGENTAEILTGMGYSEQEIESLAADGAVVIRN